MYQISLFFVTRHSNTFELKNNHKTGSSTNAKNSLCFCACKITRDEVWEYTNLQLHESVTDLYFGLYYYWYIFHSFLIVSVVPMASVFIFLILYVCTDTICHLPVTLWGASLFISRKARRSQTTHSKCLGTQWPDARYTSDNTDSKKEQKLVTRTHYFLLIPVPHANLSPRYVIFLPVVSWEYISGNKWKQNLPIFYFTSQTRNYTAEL